MDPRKRLAPRFVHDEDNAFNAGTLLE